MYVIAGLGNPGKKYEGTRHNMGFMVIDRLAEEHGIRVGRIKHRALVGEGVIANERVMLVKPQTYMNLSGESLREVMDYYGLPIENLIVIYDDLDLDTGALRIRKKGSAGSHNGMKSVIYQLMDDNFPRIRLGIGESGGRDRKDFVCGRPGRDEAAVLSAAVRRAAEAVRCIFMEGIDIAMSRFNTSGAKGEKEG